ncbi:MAG: rRNA pseudouridine synthase [Clostridia bacterium]|nr:rRNA pseudouridine synthase [Clostridia bacterium]
MRLDKLLSDMGYGSRREVKIVLKRQQVKVNGVFPKSASIHVDPEVDEVLVNGERVVYKPLVYLMMNKPAGVISATEDKRDQTVIDLVDEAFSYYDLHPVGRLDKDTVGLLILTNDGKLSHELLSPKKHVPKTYYAKIDGIVTEEDVNAFDEGINVNDEYTTLPAQLKILKSGELSEIEVTIYEGKYHQVKRMFIARGKEVVYLKRLAMGQLQLDETLEEGMSRELTEEELDLLQNRE